MDENIVRFAIESLHLSPPEFAKLVGVTPRAVSLWLNDQREVPGPAKAYIRLILTLPTNLRRREIENVLIDRRPAMRPHKYQFLLWQLLSASDSGKFDIITADEVERYANAGTITAFLVSRLGDYCDFSLFEPNDWKDIGETWSRIANAIDRRRKFGVDEKGICLLMAYTLQSIQMLETETA